MKVKLLVLQEKHGPRYFAYSTIQELEAAAMFIVTEREENDEFVDLNKKEYRLLEKANGGDGAAALALLQSRSSWEYEGFELEETVSY